LHGLTNVLTASYASLVGVKYQDKSSKDCLPISSLNDSGSDSPDKTTGSSQQYIRLPRVRTAIFLSPVFELNAVWRIIQAVDPAFNFSYADQEMMDDQVRHLHT